MSRGRESSLVFWVTLALGLVVSAFVWRYALPQQIARACWLGEWPFEDGCEQYPTGNMPGKPSTVYIEHLKQNPGDSRAWGFLTHAWWTEKDPRALKLLPYAKKLAPYSSSVLVVQAESALQARDWPAAAEALVLLVDRGYDFAVKPLTALMLAPESQDAVLAKLTPESRWLESTLASLDAKVSPTLLLRFVYEGSRLGILQRETALAMVDRLQQAGAWLDAYSLWVSLNGSVSEGLFNAGFDQRALRRGFDWTWPEAPPSATVGMRVFQSSASPKPGAMLELELTGRAALPQPMVSQPVLLLGDRYRLSGQYMSDSMRTTDGLVWALRCADGGERWAQTTALKDTARRWQPFALDLRVPAQCHGAVRLQLEAASPGEAGAGMAGRVYFDDFELKPITTEGKP